MNEQTSQPRPVIGGTRKHMGVATSDPTQTLTIQLRYRTRYSTRCS